MVIRCPICGERAEHHIYNRDSGEFPAGPAIRICHAPNAAYVHVLEGRGDD